MNSEGKEHEAGSGLCAHLTGWDLSQLLECGGTVCLLFSGYVALPVCVNAQ